MISRRTERIGAFSDPACRDICPDIGIRCASAALLDYGAASRFCRNGSCPGITP